MGTGVGGCQAVDVRDHREGASHRDWYGRAPHTMEFRAFLEAGRLATVIGGGGMRGSSSRGSRHRFLRITDLEESHYTAGRVCHRYDLGHRQKGWPLLAAQASCADCRFVSMQLVAILAGRPFFFSISSVSVARPQRTPTLTDDIEKNKEDID